LAQSPDKSPAINRCFLIKSTSASCQNLIYALAIFPSPRHCEESRHPWWRDDEAISLLGYWRPSQAWCLAHFVRCDTRPLWPPTSKNSLPTDTCSIWCQAPRYKLFIYNVLQSISIDFYGDRFWRKIIARETCPQNVLGLLPFSAGAQWLVSGASEIFCHRRLLPSSRRRITASECRN